MVSPFVPSQHHPSLGYGNNDETSPLHSLNAFSLAQQSGERVLDEKYLSVMMPHALFKITYEQLLHDLYRAYKRARLHKACSADQQSFELHLEEELVRLADELYTRTYQPSPSICFVICDPKQREVFAANFRDRVVHHLYYTYTHQLYERTFIADSYSCIENRGTHYGIRRLIHHIRGESSNYRRPCYILKVDVKGYFMHINRAKLYALCMRTLESQRGRMLPCGKPWEAVRDYDLVCFLTKTFALQNPLLGCQRRGNPNDWKGLPPSKSLFFSAQGCGLPIGNLTSQLFSNVYMNEFDHYCKRTLRCHRYGRYVDDAYVVSSDKEWLRSIVPLMRQFLATELGLELHPQKTRIDSSQVGVLFLGAYLKPWRTYVGSHTVKRMTQKVRMLDPESCTPRYLRSAMGSFAGVFSHYKGEYVCRFALSTPNRELLRLGFFTSGMKGFQIYRSVMRRWYRQFESSFFES